MTTPLIDCFIKFEDIVPQASDEFRGFQEHPLLEDLRRALRESDRMEQVHPVAKTILRGLIGKDPEFLSQEEARRSLVAIHDLDSAHKGSTYFLYAVLERRLIWIVFEKHIQNYFIQCAFNKRKSPVELELSESDPRFTWLEKLIPPESKLTFSRLEKPNPPEFVNWPRLVTRTMAEVAWHFCPLVTRQAFVNSLRLSNGADQLYYMEKFKQLSWMVFSDGPDGQNVRAYLNELPLSAQADRLAPIDLIPEIWMPEAARYPARGMSSLSDIS